MPDQGIEENIKSVNRNFGTEFQVSSGIGIGQFMNLIDERNLLVHLTMYGSPLDERIQEIRDRSKTSEKMFVFVGAEKVPGIAYLRSDFNVSVTNQPISEVSALALFLDRYFEGDELKNETHGRIRISGNARGKSVTFYPDKKDCMELLLKYKANEWLIEHSTASNQLAMIIANKIECNREIVDAGSLLHDIGRTVTGGIQHAYEGFEICKKENIGTEISNCVLKHTGAGITGDEARKLGLPDLDFMPRTIEEKIVSTADNLILGNERISIEDQLRRYREKGLVEAAERMELLFKEIEEISKLDLDSLEI